MKCWNRSVLVLTIVAISIGTTRITRGDDRELLYQTEGARPNVLVILDSSGSMNDDPSSDSYNYGAWMDDPNSKIQTAKRVLLKVLPTVYSTLNLNIGFSTYLAGTASQRGVYDTGGTSHDTNASNARKQFLYSAGTQKSGSAIPWTGSATDTKGIEAGSWLQFGGITPFGGATCWDISGVTYGTSPFQCPSPMAASDGGTGAAYTGYRRFYSNFGYTGTGTVNYLGNTTTGVTTSACTGSTANNTCAFQGSATSTWCQYTTTLKNKSGAGTNETIYDKCRMDLTFVKKTGGTGVGDYADQQVQVHEVVKHYPCTQITGTASNSPCTTFSSSATSDAAKTYDVYYNRATDYNDSTWDGSFLVGYDAEGGGASADITSASPCSHWQSELNPTTGAADDTTSPLVPIPPDSAGYDPLNEFYNDGTKTRAGLAAYLRRTSSIVTFNKSNYSYALEGDMYNHSPSLEEITNISWANNSTPLAGALSDALAYFKAKTQFTSDSLSACRNTYVILITDGLDTCATADSCASTRSTSPCGIAKSFHTTTLGSKTGIPIYVVGFGLGTTSGNALQCISDLSQGVACGTSKVYTPTNATDLESDLTQIFTSLATSPRDFATVAVPSVSTSSDGVAYISTFEPLNQRSVWKGHIRELILASNGQIPLQSGTSYPSVTPYVFGSGTTAPSGSVVWEAGDYDSALSSSQGSNGLLQGGSPNKPSGATQWVNPSTVLSNGATWSESTHDQASGVVGRNLFFGIKPGDSGCTSTTMECLVQIPVGTGGNNSTELFSVPSPPSTLPTWWTNVRDSTTYANIPAAPLEGSSTTNRSQALQNSFSFIRGNRDPVVEALAISTNFTSSGKCGDIASLKDSSGDSATPCYYGDTLGDIFHGNPAVVSSPANLTYFQAKDSGTTSFGAYSDRSHGYRSFFTSYQHRRKVLYAASDDGFVHAIDAGVYNGDVSSYTDTTVTPNVTRYLFQNRYDLGSGREIFGYAPRTAVGKFYELSHQITQDWTVDNAPIIDDVFIDTTKVGGTASGVISSNSCSGTACTSDTRTWHTVLIGSEREGGITPTTDSSNHVYGGGGSIFAIDITNPDKPAHMDSADNGVIGSPECLINGSSSVFVPGSSSAPTGCTSAYPQILWELTDNAWTSATAQTGAAGQNEKSSGSPPEYLTQDLGYTWSRPVMGRIKLVDKGSGSVNKDMFVAIFGGGYIHNGTTVANDETAGDTGNYLYMIDVETGKIVYKRNLGVWTSTSGATGTQGSLEAGAPGEPAVVDVNQDGYLDYIYIGDTQGRLFKVDMTTPANFNTSSSAKIDSDQWAPTLFFDEYTSATADSGEARQPIFDTPAVYLVGTASNGKPKLGIAFGTGDRDNMATSSQTYPNWIFAILDDTSVSSPSVIHKGDLSSINITSATACTATTSAPNVCFNGTGRGFYYKLQTSPSAEIVNSDPLVFNGSIFFTTFLYSPPGSGSGCAVSGTAYTYQIGAETGVSQITSTDSSGNTTIEANFATGADVASAPIVYQAPGGKEYVVSALDNTKIQNLNTPAPPIVKIKSWKEQ